MDYTSYIFSNPPRDVNAPIFVDADRPGRTITWQQYASDVKKVAVGLSENGLLDQECVALLSPNDIYLAVLGDAVTAAGGIFSGLPAAATASELAGCCSAADVKWLFTTPQLLDHALRAAKEAGIPDDRVCIFDPPGLDTESSQNTSKRMSFSRLLGYDDKLYVNPNWLKDPKTRILSGVFTSGTTGASKAANISHAASIARLEMNPYGYTSNDVNNLHFIGMHHVSGTRNRQKAAAGHHRMYVSNVQDPAEIVSLVRKHNIQSMMMPPRTMIAMREVVRNKVRDRSDLQSIQCITIGGSQVPNEAMDDFKAVLRPEAELRIYYGSTELGIVSWQDWRSPAPIERQGYVGCIAPGVEARIIDPGTQQDAEPGTDGEICGRGPQDFSGYCGNEKATEEAFIVDAQGEHWYRSGDRGRMDGDHLSVTGRYKEIFKVGTEEVAPAEVEVALLEHAGVKDAAVASTEDRNDSRYHEVKAYVVRKEQKRPTAQELVDFVAAQITPYKAPTGGVTMINEIPRNPMKKVVTRLLKGLEPLQGSVGYMEVLKN